MTILDSVLGLPLGATLGAGLGDWRTSVPGALETFRFDLADYIVDVSGTVDSVTGALAGYVLPAPSAGQRPAWDGSKATFVAASAQILRGAAALAALFNGAQAYSIYTIGRYTAVSNFYSTVAVADATVSNAYIVPVHHSNTGRFDSIRVNGANLIAPGLASNTAQHVFVGTYDGATITTWVDGVADAGATGTQDPTTLNTFAIGGLPILTPVTYAPVEVREVFVCLAAHDAAQISTVTTKLLQDHA